MINIIYDKTSNFVVNNKNAVDNKANYEYNYTWIRILDLLNNKLNMNEIIERQQAIAAGDCDFLPLPKFKVYTICNLRGGIGKTSIAFNLTYLMDDVLAVDTCPQCSLSNFFDAKYSSGACNNVRTLIQPHIYPQVGSPNGVAAKIGATNEFFANKGSYFIGSSEKLYFLPSEISQALAMAINRENAQEAVRDIITSLKQEVDREMRETKVQKCLIDTSPFFSGATMLSWFASQALIVPVRTDRQSVSSLKLLIQTLQSPDNDFNRYRGDIVPPKIQAVILTHCGWSTSAGARNVANNQTRVYLQEIYDLVHRHITLFSTDNPANHVFMLDDFLGCGRISSALSKPIDLLQPGETHTISRIKTEVNQSVTKIKNELKYIKEHL